MGRESFQHKLSVGREYVGILNVGTKMLYSR